MLLECFRRSVPAAIVVVASCAAAWAAPLADAPLPKERPNFEGDSERAGERMASAQRGIQGLAPVVSDEVAEATRAALEHVFAERYAEALAAQRDLTDPLAIALVEYFYILEAGSQVPHQRIATFLEAYPDWPAHARIRRIHEVALLVQRAGEPAVLDAFGREPPITNPGKILHATALRANGEEDRAEEMMRELWRHGSLTEGEEQLIRQRFASFITRDDVRFRMARMAYAGHQSSAQRLARELGEGYLKLVEARLRVTQDAGAAEAALEAVPQELRGDPLYQFIDAQRKRRIGDTEGAAERLLNAPRDPALLVDPDTWSVERQIVARLLIEAGDAQTAYAVIAGHSAEGAVPRIYSDWLAGWAALRFLDDPSRALTHFEQLSEVAGRPISMARAEYWQGRAADALGDEERAARHFAAAAMHPTTYYGQLALDRIARAEMTPARKPIHADAARRLVQEREPLRALRLLAQAGFEDRVPRLLMALAEATDDETTLVGLAELAHRAGDPGVVVQIGKQGTYAGAPTETYAFTQLGIPEFPSVGPAAEPALVHAIARQESLFNTSAVSPAGALGLLQLMPATARETAETYGLSYSRDRLTADPAYNAALGSAHLGELIAEFGDAYALVFAAYNAGRSRVYQWLQRFGDPRTGEVDAIDWVEMIPFRETRNYVQRVMEGLQVYRAGIEGGGPLLIARDLRLPDEARGDIHIAADDADPFAEISDAELAETADPARGLGFAPDRGFSFGSTAGGSAAGSFGFGGN